MLPDNNYYLIADMSIGIVDVRIRGALRDSVLLVVKLLRPFVSIVKDEFDISQSMWSLPPNRCAGVSCGLEEC